MKKDRGRREFLGGGEKARSKTESPVNHGRLERKEKSKRAETRTDFKKTTSKPDPMTAWNWEESTYRLVKGGKRGRKRGRRIKDFGPCRVIRGTIKGKKGGKSPPKDA